MICAKPFFERLTVTELPLKVGSSYTTATKKKIVKGSQPKTMPQETIKAPKYNTQGRLA